MSLLDDVLVVNKLKDEVRTKRKNCDIVKIYFEKAYDFVY